MAAFKRFASRAVEERFQKFFISRQLLEEQGFQHTDVPHSDIEHYLFDKIHYQKWSLFCLQPDRANATIVREFYAHGPNESSPFIFVRGRPVQVDAGSINAFYGQDTTMDEHSLFLEDIDEEAFEQIKTELCEEGTQWQTGSHKGSILRSKLKPEAKLWATFINRRILPTSHNSNINRTRLALIHSIMNKRIINVGELIIEEIYECAKKERGPLCLPSLISGLCMEAAVPIEETDEYTPTRKGWDRNAYLKLMQIIDVDPVQATPMTAGASQSAAAPPSPQSAAAADPYQQIIQKLEAMEIRQRRYMEYTRDFNASFIQMMQQTYPEQNVQFPPFPANLFPPEMQPQYAEETPAPAARRPFPSYYTEAPARPEASGTSRPQRQATPTFSATSASRRQTRGKAPAVSPIRSKSSSESWESEIRAAYAGAGISHPQQYTAAAGSRDVEEGEEGDTEIMDVEEEEEEEEGDEVITPAQSITPSRVQPSRRAKSQLTPEQAKRPKLTVSPSRPRKLILQSTSSSEDF